MGTQGAPNALDLRIFRLGGTSGSLEIRGENPLGASSLGPLL